MASTPRTAQAVMIRAWFWLIAVLVVVSLIVQFWVAADAASVPSAHAVGTLRGTDWPGRFVRVLSFFTIQSNILSAATAGLLALNPQRDGRIWRPLRLTALLGISITGIVYSAVLAGQHTPVGWREVATNTVFHYVVPAMMLLGWLVFGPRPRIQFNTVLGALIWPAAWLVYALIFGAVTQWYPYPFLDVTQHGYGRVAGSAVLVMVLFFLVVSLFWLGDRRLPTAVGTPVEGEP